MAQPNTRNLLCILVLSLILSPLTKGQPPGTDEVQAALTALGAGSADELKGRLMTGLITEYGNEHRSQAIAELPGRIRNYRITRGILFRRVEGIWNQVLQFQGRSGKVGLFLYQDELPSAMLRRGCELILSDCLADSLYKGELAGIFAHELGHSYFADEMATAVRTQDARAMRVVELKCDGVALLTLILLGYDPASYVRGLSKIEAINKTKGLSKAIFQTHPRQDERAEFSQRFIKSLSIR